MSVISVLFSLVLAAQSLGGKPSASSDGAVGAPPPPSASPQPATTDTTENQTAAPAPSEPPPSSDIDETIKAAYASAEKAQGPLDGRWRLSGGDGVALFDFVLADTGGTPASKAATDAATIEGAWRDLRREGGVGGSGVIESVTHVADRVEIRFHQADPASPTVLTLRAGAEGVWSGDMVEGGVRRPVVMSRF